MALIYEKEESSLKYQIFLYNHNYIFTFEEILILNNVEKKSLLTRVVYDYSNITQETYNFLCKLKTKEINVYEDVYGIKVIVFFLENLSILYDNTTYKISNLDSYIIIDIQHETVIHNFKLNQDFPNVKALTLLYTKLKEDVFSNEKQAPVYVYNMYTSDGISTPLKNIKNSIPLLGTYKNIKEYFTDYKKSCTRQAALKGNYLFVETDNEIYISRWPFWYYDLMKLFIDSTKFSLIPPLEYLEDLLPKYYWNENLNPGDNDILFWSKYLYMWMLMCRYTPINFEKQSIIAHRDAYLNFIGGDQSMVKYDYPRWKNINEALDYISDNYSIIILFCIPILYTQLFNTFKQQFSGFYGSDDNIDEFNKWSSKVRGVNFAIIEYNGLTKKDRINFYKKLNTETLILLFNVYPQKLEIFERLLFEENYMKYGTMVIHDIRNIIEKFEKPKYSLVCLNIYDIPQEMQMYKKYIKNENYVVETKYITKKDSNYKVIPGLNREFFNSNIFPDVIPSLYKNWYGFYIKTDMKYIEVLGQYELVENDNYIQIGFLTNDNIIILGSNEKYIYEELMEKYNLDIIKQQNSNIKMYKKKYKLECF
jgi:hypothetical protein